MNHTARMIPFWSKALLWDYVPSSRAGIVVLVNTAARDAMKKRRQTLGHGKWRLFWSGEDLLLQALVFDYKKCELMLHSYQIKFLINNQKHTYKALVPDYFKNLLKSKRLKLLN